MKEATKYKYGAAALLVLCVGFVIYNTNPELFSVTPPVTDTDTPDCASGEVWSSSLNRCVNIIPNYGEQATIDVACYDQELETPLEKTVNMSVFEEGKTRPIKAKGTYDTSATFTSTVGAKLDLYPIYTSSARYYGMPVLNYYVDSENEYIECEIFNASSVSEVNMTAYGNDGISALSAGGAGGTNFSLGLGASQSDQIFVQVKNINKDNVYHLCGFAWNMTDNITDVTILESGWSKDDLPQHLRSAGLDEIWTHATINLHEWDWQRFEFNIEAGSTDPAGGDMVNIVPKDCAYYEKVDQTIGYGYADDTTSEADVGLTEATATEAVMIYIT